MDEKKDTMACDRHGSPKGYTHLQQRDARFLTIILYQDHDRAIKLFYFNMKSLNFGFNFLYFLDDQILSPVDWDSKHLYDKVKLFLSSTNEICFKYIVSSNVPNLQYYKDKRIHYKPFSIANISTNNDWTNICIFNNADKGFTLNSYDNLYHCIACKTNIKYWNNHHN
ncbi:hypothetical protein CYY_003857 [Polysphondylium violaceum]|uniref:Uncharacterized protein n=1 Tax=Polysphondylium violaceum TaxID=133409 RepID=A0A8J4Q6B3_9MYCE|nr:hypothetical protein CYY_003857 [Polysphondylium violaceum]